MSQSCHCHPVTDLCLPIKIIEVSKTDQSVLLIDMSLGCFADMDSAADSRVSSEISGSVSGSGYSSSSEDTDDNDEP